MQLLQNQIFRLLIFLDCVFSSLILPEHKKDNFGGLGIHNNMLSDEPYKPVDKTKDLVCAIGGRQKICIPPNYQKYDLPNMTGPTFVTIGVDIKDIPKVSDQDFSITLNAYFNVKWRDPRLLVSKDYSKEGPPKDHESSEDDGPSLTPINLHILHNLWLPDVEILDLKAFETHSVLSKLEGIWIDSNLEVMYALATRITFICPMRFNAFPMDIQICKFKVGSFNYPMSKMTFLAEFVPEDTSIKSILDYKITFNPLDATDTHYMAIGMNYSVTGFELVLTRKMSFYIVTYYLPSGLFVVVSWISFLVNPEIIPGRMTLLVTIFLVLINIHNTIQTNSPKAEGLTAIECWVIACIIFVFGALLEYTVILLKLKLKKVRGEKFVNGSVQNGGSGGSRKKRVHGSINRPDRFSRTDLIFLCVFPVLFIIFNLCYWTAIYWWRWHNWTRVQGVGPA